MDAMSSYQARMRPSPRAMSCGLTTPLQPEMRPGQLGSVVAIPTRPPLTHMVEFGDGSDVEIPWHLLTLIETTRSAE